MGHHAGHGFACRRGAGFPAMLALIGVAMSGLAGTARADQVTQFWPRLEVYRPFHPNLRSMLQVAPVNEVGNGHRTGLEDIDYGLDLDTGLFPIARGYYRPSHYNDQRMRYLRFRSGLHYIDYTEDSGRSEWRLIAELTPRAIIPLDLHLEFRNRFDLRWIDDAYSWRYRPRLKLEHEFKLTQRHSLVPYGSGELYWDSRSDDWIRTRYEVGVSSPLTSWFAPDLYWAHQIDDGTSGDTITDAVGLTLAFYF